GNYIDEVLTMDRAARTFYYHANHLYSIAALTNAAGNVVERYRYDTYGKRTVLAPNGTTVLPASAYGNQKSFTGQYEDNETGLLYFRARMYSPVLGRFSQRDWYVNGYNMYASYFVPNFIDPTGHERKSRDVVLDPET